ncbi:uncharacterized protein LOC135317587 isoform X2 [Phalacrocorax carbo]|uniref:uncharacterized protein LOC135317587 isoform X2 n=1 Tax=Phalacrocorax carbo TaxID=9209 RepID=UPI00311A5E21
MWESAGPCWEVGDKPSSSCLCQSFPEQSPWTTFQDNVPWRQYLQSSKGHGCLQYLRNESAFLGELVFGSADTIELSCDSHGSSVPVFWFKDGIGIAPPSRARTGQKLLKIISVSCDGSGLHSCKARHSDQVLGNFTARGTDMAGGDGYPASRLGSRADTLGYRMGPQRAKYEAERGKSSQRSSEVLKEILKDLDKAALEMDRETAENEALQEGGSHAVPVSDDRRGAIQSVEVPA